jgi:hypothetical protein
MLERCRPQAWILGLSLMLTTSACAGTATAHRPQPSPQKYVSVVCGAVLDWKDVLEVESSVLVSAGSSVRATEGRKALAGYFKALIPDTETMIAKIRSVGEPALANGREVQTDVVRLLNTLRSNVGQAEVDGRSATIDGAAPLVGQIERWALSTVSGLQSRLHSTDNPVLSQAAAADPDCTKLFRRKAPVGLGA